MHLVGILRIMMLRLWMMLVRMIRSCVYLCVLVRRVLELVHSMTTMLFNIMLLLINLIVWCRMEVVIGGHIRMISLRMCGGIV